MLPKNYKDEDIIILLKKYYPHEWQSVEIKCEYYNKKDRYLKSIKGKTRYNMQAPERILQNVPEYRRLISSEYRKKYALEYNEKIQLHEIELLWKKRESKIQKINKKVENAKLKTQQMTPSYIDKLIGLYERKDTSQKDRMYIIVELQKYYSPKVIQFFYKLNDTELNKQLRWIAFYHLQSFNYQPRARSQKYMQVHTKNKKTRDYLKNIYPNEHYDIPKNPDELEYRIENAKEQKMKRFDFFISHSSKDSSIVQKLISYENGKGYNIFCDWINDVDYLKRHLICDATLKVIEKRLEQSNAIIFVESTNSINSIWCKYELNYFEQFKRPIFCVKKVDVADGKFVLSPMNNKWYLDSDYKNYVLIGNKS